MDCWLRTTNVFILTAQMQIFHTMEYNLYIRIEVKETFTGILYGLLHSNTLE